jgi:hypothetical protein
VRPGRFLCPAVAAWTLAEQECTGGRLMEGERIAENFYKRLFETIKVSIIYIYEPVPKPG